MATIPTTHPKMIARPFPTTGYLTRDGRYVSKEDLADAIKRFRDQRTCDYCKGYTPRTENCMNCGAPNREK